MLAGCMAIICASNGESPQWGLRGFEWAYIFIAIAAVADFCDGFAARLLKAYSNLGKELDSLCDLVSFGVAPGLIMYYLLDNPDVLPWLKWCTLIIPAACALRLARFNIDSRQTSVFIGLPVPANAIFWIGYSYLMTYQVGFLSQWYVFLPVLVIIAWLMNSPLKMFSLKFSTWSLKDYSNIRRYSLVAAAAVFCFSLGVGGLMWLIIFYILLSINYKS